MRGPWVGALALTALAVGAPAFGQAVNNAQLKDTPQNQTRQISGVAAYYDKGYRGKTAAGERYDPDKFTAAHKSLPFGTRLRVTDKHSGRSVDVVVNDRGPFTKGRILDLSYAAAVELRMTGRGVIMVNAEGL
jgi:peptidoglycan lytic transglycosylase